MDRAEKSYPTIAEAAMAPLAESSSALSEASVDYVVAGGWVPYLRARHQHLIHPGTRDVDILFTDDRDSIRNAVERLLSLGYLLSAKHEFQLLRKFKVGSSDLVFNIDLMHPAEAAEHPQMFQDIIDLGIREDYDASSTRKVKSICFPSSLIVFEQKLFSPYTLPDGTVVPLLDEAASILSKCTSVKNEKRTRDAFDIYFLLASDNGVATAKKLRTLSSFYPQVKEQLGKLFAYLDNPKSRFDTNALLHSGHYRIAETPSDFVRRLLRTSSDTEPDPPKKP